MAFLSRVGSVMKQGLRSASNPSIYQTLRCMSSSKIFIGGLPWAVDDNSLRDTFSQYGEVIDAKVIIDREFNRSRGFGFVTFASTEEASSAVQAMDGKDLQGRTVKVDYATERAPRPFSGGDGGFSGGYSGGGGGYNSGGGYAGGYGGNSGQQSFGGGNSGGPYGGSSGDFDGGSAPFGGGSAEPLDNDDFANRS